MTLDKPGLTTPDQLWWDATGGHPRRAVSQPIAPMSRLPFLCLPVLILATAVSAQTTPSYDFYICGTITQSDHGESSPEALSGLFRWGEDGSWHLVGPADPTVSAFAVDPTDGNFLYLTALNGLWRSSDGGSSWRICNDWTMTEGRAVAVDPRSSPTLGHRPIIADTPA